MAEFFEYNKDNGMVYSTEMKNEDDMIIRAEQDVEPILDEMARRRNANKDSSGISKGFWHYCSIPVHVELELRQKGINIYNKHQTKELLKEINTNYPYLKATRLHHE